MFIPRTKISNISLLKLHINEDSQYVDLTESQRSWKIQIVIKQINLYASVSQFINL